MISEADLQEQARLAQSSGRTPDLVRQLIAASVIEATLSLFPANPADHCLAVAMTARSLLKQFQIDSQPFVVDLCFARVLDKDDEFGWAGYWGKDHQIVLLTQFSEIVDLTIGMNPVTEHDATDEPLSPPPVWWDADEDMPAHLCYLPVGRHTTDLELQQQYDSDRLIDAAIDRGNELIKKSSTDQPLFGPLLENVGSLEQLRASGNAWLVRADSLSVDTWPLPEEIQKRMDELSGKSDQQKT